MTLQINPEKIGDLIGPKGKTIRGIQDETGAELTVDDTGLVTIAAVGGEAMERARQMVQAITAEPVVGETYEGTVKTTTRVRRVRRDHAGHRRPGPHLGDAPRAAPRRRKTSSTRAIA